MTTDLEQRILDYLYDHPIAYFWEIATSLSTVEHPISPEQCQKALQSLIDQGKAECVEFQMYRAN